MECSPVHDAIQLGRLLGVEIERKQIIELLPAVQSLDIIYGQVPFHLWTERTRREVVIEWDGIEKERENKRQQFQEIDDCYYTLR